VLAMPDARVDSTQWVESFGEVSLGASVLQHLESGMAVGVIFNHLGGADGDTVTH
jgi:hypothetical protein